MPRLTTEEIEAISKRTKNATEGPWKYNAQYGYLSPVTPQRQIAVICNEITRNTDADFIAEARTDVPKLLAEVQRLRRALAEIDVMAVRYDADDRVIQPSEIVEITYKTLYGEGEN